MDNFDSGSLEKYLERESETGLGRYLEQESETGLAKYLPPKMTGCYADSLEG
ncbi:hypothetical protein CKALI_06470 [Corynebacterium kalinowskii]|uniref:Uncharacterized protein n=1 Tax=Corynebacterium kalinowskii TaxID=2675216 RepID=A0A6B8VDB4_9CORY|nr:hypothetical protein CKALI_06470 [Corynebacterium kalinowskii]